MTTPFTLADINRAHEGVSQSTVRDYLTALHDLGVVSYTSYIQDGHSEYFDSAGASLSSAPVHEPQEIADHADHTAARLAFDAHGRRETSYLTFVRQLAAAGVFCWVMDPVEMTCTLSDRSGETMLVEPV